MCQAFPYRVSGGPIDENLVEDGDALIYGAMALIRPLVWSSLSTGSINPSNLTATYKNHLFSGDFLIVCQAYGATTSLSPLEYLQDGLQRWGYFVSLGSNTFSISQGCRFFLSHETECFDVHMQSLLPSWTSGLPFDSFTTSPILTSLQTFMESDSHMHDFRPKIICPPKEPETLNSSGNRSPSTCLLMSPRLFSWRSSSVSLFLMTSFSVLCLIAERFGGRLLIVTLVPLFSSLFVSLGMDSNIFR
jgi:hypothetical protein